MTQYIRETEVLQGENDVYYINRLVYDNPEFTGRPIKTIPVIVDKPLPESKLFDTNLIHIVFDPVTDAAEYKAFCNDPRVARIINSKEIELSAISLAFAIKVAQAVAAEGIISAAKATTIEGILNGWAAEVAAAS